MDIDGTLTNEDKIISENTKNKLKELQSQGAVLVLASGRPTRGLMHFAKELEMDKHNGLLVSFNGARVTDCETGDILFDQTMTVDTCKAVLNHMKNFDVIPMVYKGEYLHVTDVYNNIVHAYGRELNIIHYESRLCNYKLCEVDDLEEFADFPMNKILTAGEPDYLQENYKKMMEPFKDSLNCVFTADMYFEFTEKGIDKANALHCALTPLGYTKEDMIAFGDAQNDKTMLEYAGIGVAMGNATQEIKDIADYITLSNNDDGIVHALNELLK
ncbi:MAG: HAD family phosphatase [Tyzzerella sp.]|uniref:HAD family phosphatase n=1 Tax=Candidatus Fimicola merdigallinarum TaxID=2840819 RepID=A0A9D9DX48_9FIRM|nr:HAD family phosphatase [Candidatus Fimicola merdigallinarum]